MQSSVTKKALLKLQFGAAFIAGVVYWIVLWCWKQSPHDLFWSLQHPWLFVKLVVVYPVLEEIVFRGGVQTLFLKFSRLRTEWFGITLANVLTSAIFAALHLFTHSPLWAAATFFPSLVFGFFRDRTVSILGPIALHVYYNFGFYLVFGA
jgi:uncharacterized protein